MQRLVLELAIRKEQTNIDWLKTAIEVLTQDALNGSPPVVILDTPA